MEQPTNEDCSSSSKKIDNEYSEIEGVYSTVRDFESPSSSMDAEPLNALCSSQQADDTPVYAVPIPKPRRTRPASGRLEANLSLDAEASLESFRQLNRISLSDDKKAQFEHSPYSSIYSENDKHV